MTLTITSFSSVLLSAIMRVSATRVLSAMRFVPSGLVLYFSRDQTFTFRLNCRKFCDS